MPVEVVHRALSMVGRWWDTPSKNFNSTNRSFDPDPGSKLIPSSDLLTLGGGTGDNNRKSNEPEAAVKAYSMNVDTIITVSALTDESGFGALY